MKCERCRSYRGRPAEFRIVSEIIDLKVCADCVGLARELGLRVEALCGESSVSMIHP
jgi:hypothetical protein